MKNLYRVLLIVSLVSECGFSRNAFSQTTYGVGTVKRDFLGKNRYTLMQFCHTGRKLNRVGDSVFDGRMVAISKESINTPEFRGYDYRSFLAGLTAAMFEVCPDVK
jgi:hypothetical protein